MDYDFKQQFKKARNLFNEWDPMDLISSGAPEDEYDPYVYKLLSCLNRNMSETETAEVLSKEFTKMFSEKFTAEQFMVFVKDAISQIKEKNIG